MSLAKVSTVVRAAFSVFNSSNVAVTSLVTANFTLLLQKDGADDATSVSIVEVGSGRYEATFTPGSVGKWTLNVRHATHNPRGWVETFEVTASGADPNTFTKDGLTMSEHAGTQTAVLAGKVSGGPSGSVFRAADDSADRVAMTANSSGNRTSVTITP